jgi:hypothetical protein
MRVSLLFFIIFILSIISLDSLAQNHEVGLKLKGFSDFDFIYKKQKSEHLYKRINVGFGNLALGGISGNSIFILEAGLGIGNERRKEIADKLDFIRGWQYLLSGSISNGSLQMNNGGFNINVTGGAVAITPGMGYLLGLNYRMNERFSFGLEFIPSLNASFVFGGSSSGTLLI